MTKFIRSSFCGSSTCVEFSRSSFCGGEAACAETAHDHSTDEFLIRDSKNPDSPVLRFTRDEWSAFIKGAKNGEFDV